MYYVDSPCEVDAVAWGGEHTFHPHSESSGEGSGIFPIFHEMQVLGFGVEDQVEFCNRTRNEG